MMKMNRLRRFAFCSVLWLGLALTGSTSAVPPVSLGTSASLFQRSFGLATGYQSRFSETTTRRRYTDWDYDGARVLGHAGVAVNCDRQIVHGCDDDGYLWDARTGRLLHKLVGHREPIVSVQFSPDGKYVLTGSEPSPHCAYSKPSWSIDTSLRLWSIETGKEIWTIEGQVGGTFSPNGQRLVAFSLLDPGCGGSDTLAMWDVATGRRLFSTKMEKLCGNRLAYSPDGRTFLCFTDGGGNALIYDAGTGVEIGRIEGKDSLPVSYFGLKGEIATINKDGRIEIWDANGKTHRFQIAVEPPEFGWFRWTRNGMRLIEDAFSCPDIRVYAVDSGQKLGTPAACDGLYLEHVAFLVSPDDSRSLLHLQNDYHDNDAGEVHRSLRLHDLNSGSEVARIEPSGQPVAFSPDGQTVLIYGEDAKGASDGPPPPNSFRVYNSKTGKLVATFDLGRGDVGQKTADQSH